MEDIIFKTTISLSDFEKKPKFDRIQILEEQKPFEKNINFKEEKKKLRKASQKLRKTQMSRDANKIS